MSSTTINMSPSAAVSHSDRLSLTIFFALALHAIIILGVSFNLTDEDNLDSLSTMEVTLVHNQSQDEPEKADYLAQANQLGGGNVEEKVRDSSPFSNTVPTEDEGFAPDSRQAIAPPPVPNKEQQQELLTVTQAKRKEQSKPQHEPVPEQNPQLTAAQLYERSREIARLSAEINKLKKTFQVTPQHTYVRGANARQYRFAAYMDAWRAKVERIGNLNYPEEAVHRQLTGTLLMDVAINPDGSLHSVRVLRSSGEKVLDHAAKRIVRLAAPFPPLTKDILQDTDILHIPRVWQFKNGGSLQTRAQ